MALFLCFALALADTPTPGDVRELQLIKLDVATRQYLLSPGARQCGDISYIKEGDTLCTLHPVYLDKVRSLDRICTKVTVWRDGNNEPIHTADVVQQDLTASDVAWVLMLQRGRLEAAALSMDSCVAAQ